mmetsp:Transcript_51318/g.95421  ORF Transcript_51318/g.95421 Transcript_51318/m.95421 type:complete len:463 (-) Transcript_51318:91-1479(-)
MMGSNMLTSIASALVVLTSLAVNTHAWGWSGQVARPPHRMLDSARSVGEFSPDDESGNSIEESNENSILPLSIEDREKFAMVRDNLELQLRAQAIKAGGGGEAGTLVQLMTAAPVGEVLQGFFSDASPMVTSAMREAVTGVLGGLPREVDVTYETTSEKLGSLAGMLMMTGYLFRNTEYVVTLQQLLNIKSRSLEEYKKVFDEIDVDGSGFIEISEVETLLSRFYDDEQAPSFEVDAFVRFFDRKRKGKISWSDFTKGFGLAAGGSAFSSEAQQRKQLNPSAILKELGPGSDAKGGLSAGGNEEEPVAGEPLAVSIEGTVEVATDGGNTVQVDAVVYLDALRAEAEALKSQLRVAAEAELLATSPPPSPLSPSSVPGSAIGQVLTGLDAKQKLLLTEGIEPTTVEAMRRLVAYMVGETNPSKAREFSVDRSTLASLCLWQLVTGYKLREAEATGKAKELMGR